MSQFDANGTNLINVTIQYDVFNRRVSNSGYSINYFVYDTDDVVLALNMAAWAAVNYTALRWTKFWPTRKPTTGALGAQGSFLQRPRPGRPCRRAIQPHLGLLWLKQVPIRVSRLR
jgi:hypothetical protein